METLPGRDYHAADVFDVERSRAFTHGVLAEKDALLDGFNARYLSERGPVD